MRPTPATSAQFTTTRQTTASPGDLHERICRRAYELYEARGREDGHDLADWLQAEAEVRQPKSKSVAA